MQAATKKLPESITQFLNMPKQKQCRISWRSLLTNATGHGHWHGMSHEESLKQTAILANKEFAREIHHWIEYNE